MHDADLNLAEVWKARVAAALLLALAACSDPPVEISPSSLEGCRKPGDPGCEVCCREGGGSNICRYWASAGATAETKPWFNASTFCENAPVACEGLCASCLERDEEALRMTANECDCSEVEIGIDPCEQGGCACTCDIFNRARAKCPAP